MIDARHTSFQTAVRDTILGRHLLPHGARVLVAVSGGPDSTALVAVLSALRDTGLLASVHACHVDHRLRPGSREDGDFCEALCTSLRVPLLRVSVTVAQADGLQAAARRARYRALRDAAGACGADWIATGHTRSDQAETVVQRLLRGSGARGLAGIPARRGRIVRPLLDRSRDEVLSYLRDRHLAWREDPSNRSPRFLRNRIRLEVLPMLDALVPGIERRLAQTADLLREDDRALERVASRRVDGVATAAITVLARMPAAVRRRAVRRLWLAATGSRRQLEAEHVASILRLLPRKRPGRVALPRGFEASVAYGRIRVGRADQQLPASPFGPALTPIVIRGPGAYPIPGRDEIVEIDWRAPDEPPPWPVELRTRRPGDRFHPRHAPGGKKLKAWLIDRKIPRGTRDSLLVVADGAGTILAIPELGAVSRAAHALDVVLRRRASSATE